MKSNIYLGKKDDVLTFSLPEGRSIASRTKNLEESKKDSFVDDMIEILNKKTGTVEVNAHGDFYDLEYLIKWIEISESCKHIKFITHFKAIDILEDYLRTYHVDYRTINIEFIFIADDATQEQINYVNWLGLEVIG